MKILTPTLIDLDQAKLGLTAADQLVSYDPQAPIPGQHRDADVLISWGNTDEQLADAARHLGQLKLVQALLAGPDQLLGVGFSRDVVLASGVGLHSLTVAEHALALTLNFVRFLPTLADEQEKSHWASELGGPQPLHPHDQVTTLLDARVLIWGFGSIGQETARLFKAFGAQVTGVARSAGWRGDFKVITQDQMGDYLPETDVLVMVLPASEQTRAVLNARVLSQLPPRAYLINVGRGMTVNEEDLIVALEQGQLAGAALDVTAQEPLPAQSPLWGTKNLLITPHTAGGRPVNPEELISYNLSQLRLQLAGKKPQYRNSMN